MPFANINDIQLYYELHGPENAEVLVFSNGILMSTASWALQTTVLSKYFKVLLYDCRGMWKSEHPDASYSMEQHADDLASLLEFLNIKKAHIAGISYGSEVSMVFALKYPDRTKTLVIADGVSEIQPLLSASCETWVSAAKLKNPKLLLEVTKPFNFSQSYLIKNRELIDSLESKYEQLDFDSFLRLMESFYQLNITEQLRLIEAPTLVIVGEEDLLKGRNYANLIISKIPHAEFIIIPGAGHAACLEKPGEFNSIIIGFVKKHCGDEHNV